MKILGISISHDSTIAIINNIGQVEYAIAEERISRIKCHTGFPFFAMNEAFVTGKFSGSDITHVAIGSHSDFNPNRAWMYYYLLTKSNNYVDILNEKVDIDSLYDDGWKSIKNVSQCKEYVDFKLKKILENYGISAEIFYIKHHLSHASSAYYSSGLNRALAITMDGEGDLESSTVNICNGNIISTIHSDSNECSIGNLYSAVTKRYGFKIARHEGKITGLAAHGDPKRASRYFKKYIKINEQGSLEFITQPIVKRGFFHKIFSRKYRIFESQSKYDDVVINAPVLRYADLAAGVQDFTEDIVEKYVAYWIRKTGIQDVVLAGGVFANVKLNGRIAENNSVKNIYVYPNMGDGGLAYGAAAYLINKLCGSLPLKRINDVFYGDSTSVDDIPEIIKNFALGGLKFYRPNNFEENIAKELAIGKIIGWYDGNMEYGPRALGHRSILATPSDKNINKWLNKRMNRTDFMPFAPSCMYEYANELFEIKDKLKWPAEFMTVTVNMKKKWIKKAPAVAHIDGTARPQLVRSDVNPRFHEIIRQFYLITGLPLLINTSFNMHEEPIVRTANEALIALEKGIIDVLAIDGWIVEKLN